MMLGQKMQYMWIYVYVKFSKREFQQWKMVLCKWCQLWDHSAFCSEVGGWGGGGLGGLALPYLAYTGQVCAAEQKVLSIKQGVEFYYLSSKILIIILLF